MLIYNNIMRKLLILIILVISIKGYSQNRYHWDEIIEDGSILLLDDSTMSPVNGIVYDEYENQKISFEANYKNGVNNGSYKEWHENCVYIKRNISKKHLKKMNKRARYDFKKELEDYKKWHKNGCLKIDANYKNGWEDGIYKAWHENGKLEFQGSYVNGKAEDLHKAWYKSGQLRSEIYWKKGRLISERCFDINNIPITCED